MQTTVRDLIDGGPHLSAGILSADLLHLGDELYAVEQAGVRLLHVDVMDGVFCPATTVGPPVVNALPDRFVKDVHLMIDEPLDKLDAYLDAGAGIVTIHVESTRHPHRALQRLAGTGVIRGAAVNPGTPLTAVEPLLDELDLLLLLAVNPGWGGQSFIASTERRLEQARALTADREIALGVDGGITSANARHVGELGVNVVVAGSAVFGGDAPGNSARAILGLLRA